MEIIPQIEITTQLPHDSFLNKEVITKTLDNNVRNKCNNSNCTSPIEILPNIYIDRGIIIDRII